MPSLHAALRRPYRASSECLHPNDIRTSFSTVFRTCSSLFEFPSRSTYSVIPFYSVGTRRFSALIPNGVGPRCLRRDAALKPVITFPPQYKLLPNDVHCFIGLNGSGKTQFLARLQDHVRAQARRGELPTSVRLATLSLDAHLEFVAEHGHRVVADVLGGIGSPSARDLIVRLGLFPVWEQQVCHLSTGEMRKLLLAVSLLETPRASVLILDQPFDGLDVKARRQLQWMLGQLTRGFTRLLVETTGAKHEAFAYKTQVLLVANRLEQVFPELFSHTVLFKLHESANVETIAWPSDKEDEARNKAMIKRLEVFYEEEHKKRAQMSDTELISLVKQLFYSQDAQTARIPAVQLKNVSISYHHKRILLEDVDFVRQTHEHWALLGPNGSGKSSLMRVLMETPGHGLTKGQVLVNGKQVRVSGLSDDARTDLEVRREAISTDHHIQLLRSHHSNQDEDQTGYNLIVKNASSLEAAKLAMRLLVLPDTIKTRTLAQLSQGEQKLVLIARALAARPQLLILDEITHGLDPFNRAHVLRVVQAIGKHAAERTHLVLITHHEEEITACFSHIFEIQAQKLVERVSKFKDVGK